MAGAGTVDRPPANPGKAVSWLSRVFKLNTSGLNWPRAVMVLDVILVPMVVFSAIGHEEYLLSAVFGALFAVVADPGGAYGYRAARMAVFGLIGAGVTALGFSLGGASWGWLVLASFVVTLVTSLAVVFGIHRFVSALLLNIWFIIALAVGVDFHHHATITSYTWAQALAWAGGSALWIAATFVAWMISGRRDMPQPVAEIPGDTTRQKLNPPIVAFAVIRALAIAGSVAIAFGWNLSHADWLPIATIIALKPDLGQSTLVAVQRVIGALIGAGAAVLLLLIPANEHGLRLFEVSRGLEVVAIVLVMHAVAIRFWNYALYTAAVAAAVLILLDLPQPSNYSAEGYRVLWTVIGVSIGVVVMVLGGLLAKRTAKAPPQPS